MKKQFAKAREAIESTYENNYKALGIRFSIMMVDPRVTSCREVFGSLELPLYNACIRVIDER